MCQKAEGRIFVVEKRDRQTLYETIEQGIEIRIEFFKRLAYKYWIQSDTYLKLQTILKTLNPLNEPMLRT